MDFVMIAEWAAGALIVSGIIQWAKGIAPKAPKWVWMACAPLAALGASLASKSDLWAWSWLGIWATSQLFYETIIQAVKKHIGGAP
jgi:hypothetical protein